MREEGRHANSVDQSDPASLVPAADDLGQLRAERSPQWSGRRVDRGHVHAEGGQGGGYLAADEAHPDDDGCAKSGQLGAERVGVGGRPELVNPCQVDARDRRSGVADAGGYDEVVVCELLAAREGDESAVGTKGRRGLAQPQLDAVRVVGVGGLDEQLVEVDVACEVGLAERGALVGQGGFRSDEDDVAVEAGVAQGERRGGTGEAGADDDSTLGAGGVHPGTSTLSAPSRSCAR